MGRYVILTAYLVQKGSSESRPVGNPVPQDEHSLSTMFFVLLLGSVALHAAGGARAYSEEQLAHGQPRSFAEYLGTARFWFESMQNWQSEFLAIAVMVGASVYLRERRSAESEPVAEPHGETGA